MRKKHGPYKYDEIVWAFRTVVDEVWDKWESEAAPLPGNKCEHDKQKFAALKILKYLVNGAVALRNEHDFAGHCPYCGGNDGYFNVERDHYFYCLLCRCMWLRGSNLFSSWRDEDRDIWNRNATRFNSFEFVEPVLDWVNGKRSKSDE